MIFELRYYTASIDRFGIESGSVIWHADTLEEARTVGLPSIGGVPLVGRSFATGIDPQCYAVTVTYEGKAPDGQPKGVGIEETVEGEALYIQEPIELHPNLDSLLEQFGGFRDTDGRVKFPESLPGRGTGSGSGLSRGARSSRTNPMFGRTTYAVAGCEVLHSYVREQLPADIFGELNQILDNLPSSLPSNARPQTPRGRNWMKMAPRWVARGNVVQIFDRYRLSPPGGFTKEIYQLFVR
jgi:hypothetical protein